MRAGLAVLAISTAMLTVTAVAQAPSPSPHGNLIAARQAGFLLSAANFGAMKAAIDRGDNVKALGFAARSQARWAKTIPAMFPAGSTAPKSGALPTIWSDRAGFETAAANYAKATDKLVATAAAGDKAGFAAAWGETRKTCAACHDKYRAPDEKRPG